MVQRTRTAKLHSFASLALTFNSILLALTGVILYVMPYGRIAYWNDFRIWGLGKDQWTSLHLVLALLFIILAITHAVLNIKPLISHLSRKATVVLVSAGSVLLLSLTAIIDIPPASWLMGGTDCAKNSWDEPAPPMPHFEMQTLEAVATYHGTRVEKIIAQLDEGGVHNARPGETINDLSDRTGKTPVELYEMIGGHPDSRPFTNTLRGEGGRGQGQERGVGRGQERGAGRGQGGRYR